MGSRGARNENTLSMMIINLANALRLQNREEDARKLLISKDWSGSDRSLRLGVAAVMGDIPELIKFMRLIGDTGTNAEHYRTWPVFRGLHENKEFSDTFEAIFGDPLLMAKSTTVTVSPNPPDLDTSEYDSSSPTQH
jgi:hypothetical protein